MSGHAEEEYKAVDERWVLKSEVLVFWFVFRHCFVSLSSRVPVSYSGVCIFTTLSGKVMSILFSYGYKIILMLAETWYVGNLLVLLACACMSCFSCTVR